MVYLNPPYPIIQGVSLFPDHVNPNWFYYCPLGPQLTLVRDAATGQGVPQIQVIRFKGAAGTGGFLNFDCNIGIDDKKLADVADELKQTMHLREKPVLSALPLVDGTVRLLLLGVSTPDKPPAATGAASSSASSGAAAATAPAGLQRFVTKIDQAARPSLYGDNQATFSVSLDANGETILEQALQGEMSPIGIVYSLDFLGLRPAYNVHLHIDWDRVQKALDEQFSASTLFFSTTIDKAVDKLVESRAIQLDVDTFVPEGEENAGVISNRDRAVSEVREMITNAFFTPSIDPSKPQQDGWDKAAQFAERASAIAATGGWGGIGSFGYKKTDYTRIDKKVLDVNMRERTTVKRSIFPQGHLSGLFQVLRDQHLDLSRFVIAVDTDTPWFQRRKVSVVSRANFDEDEIRSINVRLQYGNDAHNLLLEAAKPTDSVEWASIIEANGSMHRDITAQYTVNFNNIDGAQRPASLDSKPFVSTVENIEIFPRQLYAMLKVPIMANDVPWKQYSSVEVHTRYQDAANKLHQQGNFLLKMDKLTDEWKIFVLNQDATTFEYKLVYHAATGREIAGEWLSTDQQQILIGDPFPSKRTVEVVPAVSWDKVSQVFVDLSYEDPANKLSQQGSVSFSKTDPMPKSFSVSLQNPKLRMVSVEVSILTSTGDLIRIPKSYTLEPRVFVRADMKGHRIITLHPQSIDFAQLKISSVTVDLKYEDLANGISVASESVFTSAEDSANFEFDYVDAAQSNYQYRTSIRFTNGLAKDVDWQSSTANDLVISLT